MSEHDLPWVWWGIYDPEDGLLGFHTKKDRDAFSNGKPGPYRRRVSADGRTISQLEEWPDMVRRWIATPLPGKAEETR